MNATSIAMVCLQLANTVGIVVASFIGLRAKQAVSEVHIQFNSRMTELMASIRDAALAEGAEKGRLTALQERKDEVVNPLPTP